MLIVKILWRVLVGLGFLVLGLAAMGVALHNLYPSRLLLDPISLTTTADGEVTLVRRTPSGLVLAYYTDEVVSYRGESCLGSGMGQYEPRDDNRVLFRLSDGYKGCLGPGSVHTATWWPLLWGWFPLHAVTLMTKIEETS